MLRASCKSLRVSFLGLLCLPAGQLQKPEDELPRPHVHDSQQHCSWPEQGHRGSGVGWTPQRKSRTRQLETVSAPLRPQLSAVTQWQGPTLKQDLD